MQPMRGNARPTAWRQEGRARQTAGTIKAHRHNSSMVEEVAIAIPKRGKDCIICKLVKAQPLGRLVLAMPYRHRQTVEHVSLPPSALAFGRRHGATWWVVRRDLEGRCFGLPLEEVETVGWLKPSEGKPEWFVPLARFRPIAWQEWAYPERVVNLSEPEEPTAVQTMLWK
ncbi:MAG: hypothetical protein M1370_07410 [Bacteroidetes bacterium]|nr:hypothetical protein [Bacteroidota bacterium]